MRSSIDAVPSYLVQGMSPRDCILLCGWPFVNGREFHNVGHLCVQ